MLLDSALRAESTLAPHGGAVSVESARRAGHRVRARCTSSRSRRSSAAAARSGAHRRVATLRDRRHRARRDRRTGDHDLRAGRVDAPRPTAPRRGVRRAAPRHARAVAHASHRSSGWRRARARRRRIRRSRPIASDEPPAAWSAVVAARRALSRSAPSASTRCAMGWPRPVSRPTTRRALAAADERDGRRGAPRPANCTSCANTSSSSCTATAASGCSCHVEYQVAAARWAPSYVARIDGDACGSSSARSSRRTRARTGPACRCRFDRGARAVRAAARVAAAEDWPAAARARARPAFARRRPAPTRCTATTIAPSGRAATAQDARKFGVASQFEDSTYEESRARRTAARARGDAPAASAPDAFAAEVWDEDSSAGKEAFARLRPDRRWRPWTRPHRRRAGAGRRCDRVRPGSAAAEAGATRGESNLEPQSGAAAVAAPRLDYGNLMMAPPCPRPRAARWCRRPPTATRARSPPSRPWRRPGSRRSRCPSGCHADWIHTYDYAFATDGAVDVRADGAWHSIALTSRSRAPRRSATSRCRASRPTCSASPALANPFAGPLLPGPIDVYDRGRFLVTSELDYTPPGGARRGRARRRCDGQGRAQRRVPRGDGRHAARCASPPPRDLDRHREPVRRADRARGPRARSRSRARATTTSTSSSARSSRRGSGGRRIRALLAISACAVAIAGSSTISEAAKRTLRAAYEVKIAGKLELIGGNRREP